MKKICHSAIYQLLSELDGDVGLYIRDVESDETLEINPNLVLPSASVIKIPMLALLLRDVQEGRVDWKGKRRIAPVNRVGGTGILCELSEEYMPTVEELATLMIVLSDNIATNEIMDIIGIERVNEFCAEMEMPHTRLMRKMLDFEAIKKGYNNYMCAGEAGRLLTQIAEEKFVNCEVSCTIMNIMEHQQCRNKLPALLPTIPNYAPKEVKRNIQEGSVLVANKTGELVGIQHDVGIFTLPGGRRYVIAMFTGNLKSDLQAIELIGKVSRAVYDSLK